MTVKIRGKEIAITAGAPAKIFDRTQLETNLITETSRRGYENNANGKN